MKLLILLLLINQVPFIIPQMYDEDIHPAIPLKFLGNIPADIPTVKYLATINNCFCRENPGALIACYGKKCEKFPTSLNVTVPLFRLKLSSITIIEKNDLLLLRNITSLEIESNRRLIRIEPGAFWNMSNLRNVSISFNENLDHLKEGVFEGLVNLEVMLLRKNSFKFVKDIAIAFPSRHVPRLNYLDISENVFHEVKFDDFFAMNGSSLNELNMILCEIEYMDPDFLAPLKNLTFLRVGQNQFNTTVLSNVLLESITLKIPLKKINLYGLGFRKRTPIDLLLIIAKMNITHLYLTTNNFEHLDEESFPYMPNLLSLGLRNTLIVDITENAFRKLPNLKELWLSENRLNKVPVGTMLNTLDELDFSGNTYDIYSSTYFYIPDGIFSNMSNLKRLFLANNTINYLTKSTFIGLSSLTKLNLKNTFLYQIEGGSFGHLKNLKYLNLNNNPLSTYMVLNANIFKGLDHLEILLLAGCDIKNLTESPSIFKYLPNLQHLGLERNGLLTIFPHQFKPFRNMRSLNIAENDLTPWSVHILPPNLTTVAANQNKFTYLTAAMLDDWRSVETLYLQDNPFRCDCSLYPIVVWLRNNKMAIKYFPGEDFVANCVAPDTWRHKSIIEYINVLSSDGGSCERSARLNSITVLILLLCFCTVMFLSILSYFYRWYIKYWLFILRIRWKKHHIWNKQHVEHVKGNYKYDAFISYCKEDRVFVLKMAEIMESHEPYLKLCLYERDFQIGSLISDAIVQNVLASKRTVLVITDSFAKSRWCRWETQVAKYHQILFQNFKADDPDDTLIMIKLSRVTKTNMTPTLKYLMKSRIYLEWSSDPIKQKLFWEKLRTTLAHERIKK